MSFIERFLHNENPCPQVASYYPFTIHQDSMEPFGWLLNTYLQRTGDNKRYLILVYEDAVRYGKIMTPDEAVVIAQTMEIQTVDGESIYANPNDPNWDEAIYLMNCLAERSLSMTFEELQAYNEMMDEYHTLVAGLN
jgi:hypothetical protein